MFHLTDTLNWFPTKYKMCRKLRKLQTTKGKKNLKTKKFFLWEGKIQFQKRPVCTTSIIFDHNFLFSFAVKKFLIMCLYYLCANCIQFSDNCLFNSDTNFSFFVIKNVENNASAMQESKFGDKDFIKE